MLSIMNLRSLFVAALSMVFLAGCETLGYQQAFTYCDNQVGECYRNCEAYEGDEGYGSCQASCETQASACFDQAYNSYQALNVGYSVGYASPWVGNFCAWYPDRGFVSRYGRFGGSHFGYGGRGYFPGRRYRPDGRYDPRYDGYRSRRPDRGRDRIRGDRPRGDRPRGDRPRRDRPRGDRPGRDRPRSDRPRRERPRGDRPYRRKPKAAPRREPNAQPPRRSRPPAARPPKQRPPASKPPAARKPPAKRPAPSRKPATSPNRNRPARGGGGRRPSVQPSSDRN